MQCNYSLQAKELEEKCSEVTKQLEEFRGPVDNLFSFFDESRGRVIKGHSVEYLT
jgi:hypothetical protein